MSELTGPIVRRKIETAYRIIGSRCVECGSRYFPAREFCGVEGRKCKIERFSLFNGIGRIVSGSVIRDAPKALQRLTPYMSVIVSFDGVGVPGRLTDLDPEMLKREVDVSHFIDQPVQPMMRRLYDTRGGIIAYSSLSFVDNDYHKLAKADPHPQAARWPKSGITGYGVYVPRFRLKIAEVAKKFGKDPTAVEKGLEVREKAVSNLDEDSVTMAVEAGRRAIAHAGVSPREVKEVYVGTESNPYAVKPIAASVVEALALGDEFQGGFNCGAVDLEFACKAATAMFKAAVSMTEVPVSGVGNALVIGTDDSQAMPGDDLDYTVGAGAAAFMFGKKGVIATIEKCESYTTDTPDFYRRDSERFPRHEDRFTGEPAYFKHVINCARILMDRVNMKPPDFDYVVFHQPNGKFPERAGFILGFTEKQMKPGLKVSMIGNTYSGSSLIGLAGILDIAEPADKILMVSYGSGAGSDAYFIEVQEPILETREFTIPVEQQISSDSRVYVDYEFYRKSKDMQ